MPWAPAIANSIWMAANLPAYARFRRALSHPARAQQGLLRDYVRRNASTAFGRDHGFGSIETYEDFARQVPLRDYESLEPWLARVRQGEPDVLACGRPARLVPTSGSSSARKLIPFTPRLQAEFNAAIGPWLVDMARQVPGILAGPAYWSITPAMDFEAAAKSEAAERENGGRLEVGFDSDAAYLGGVRGRLVESILAVPASVQHAGSIEAFRYATLLCLLRCRELRLISVWHPSFLSLLLNELPRRWDDLLKDIALGTCKSSEEFPKESSFRRAFLPMPERARELGKANPLEAESLWPRLAVISCWGDGPSAGAAAELKRRFPGTMMQPKGLLATETFVSFPFASHRPLAINSHFFEFLDCTGRVGLAEDLGVGHEYEVVVTTGGGLWRYRLGDRVRVDGLVEKTPSLTFIGRGGNVSDLFGEKLSEMFVAEVLGELVGEAWPGFALLAPDEDAEGWRYTLFIEGHHPEALAQRLDQALARNPQYAWCRKLGQLLPARVFRVSGGGYEVFARRLAADGARLGDIKPALLSKKGGWRERFAGSYAEPVKVLQPF